MKPSGDYDAVLVVAFGGPEGPDDIMPFLENVLRGKKIPETRKLEVAHHYEGFGGVSPLNSQIREMIELLKAELGSAGIDLPVYWGNRNWHPMLLDTVQQMKADGIKRALAFIPSAYSSYSGCRQYREDVVQARETVGEGAPIIDKIRVFFNHPGFIKANSDRVIEAIGRSSAASTDEVRVIFTAHSIPTAMSEGCDYREQLLESSRLVAEACGLDDGPLVFQSRSGPPHQPWLEPDICDYLESDEVAVGVPVIVAPIGFTSDHIEVLYDLDDEAAEVCDKKGIEMVRAGTAGNHPSFIAMIRELIEERLSDQELSSIGKLPPRPHTCPEGCCARN